MEIIKKGFIYGLIYSASFMSCSNQDTLQDTQKVFVNLEKPYVTEDLRKISIDFIHFFKIDNSIIEVTIEKKELDGIYIILRCRSITYFKAMKLKPIFTYEIDNNSFFVFTGVEVLFGSIFDEAKFENRRKVKCDESFKTCYWLKDGKMIKDEKCTFPDPFSDMQMIPPPLKNKK